MDAQDRLARRGLLLALACVLASPILVVLLTAAPAGWRRAIFLVGLAGIAALAIWAGLMARKALVDGTALTWRASAGMWIGLTLGVTAAVFTLWTLVGLVFG